MNLDIRTMIMTMSLLTLVFSALLIFAGSHVGNMRCVRQWALGCFCIGLSTSFTYFLQDLTHKEWLLVCAATLWGAGIALQYYGIQVFKGVPDNWVIPVSLVALVFMQTTWFTVWHPNVHARMIANSLLFALGNAACARALLIQIEQPLRGAYWLTGGAFAMFALMLILRAVAVYHADPHSFFFYSRTWFNSIAVFIGIMSQMTVTFGFVLMLNARLAGDLQKLALTDALTGALNRRSLEQEANRLFARCTRTGDCMAVMMIDIDHFKSINDRYGHQVGDGVLKNLTAVAHRNLRVDDYFARYGGEEFCVLLPSTTEQDAWVLAERLRLAYAAMDMVFNDEVLKSTISIGVAGSLQVGLDFALLLKAADYAMYRAKQDGRNRVVVHSINYTPAAA